MGEWLFSFENGNGVGAGLFVHTEKDYIRYVL